VKQPNGSCAGIRVVIIDATRLGAESLAGMLRRSHCEVVLAATSPQQAMDVFSHSDVGLISSTLEGQPGRGFELASQARKAYPKLQLVMVVDTPDPESVVKAFQSGARGIFGRDSSPQLIAKCVGRVHEGQVWASTEQLQYIVDALTAPPRLRLTNSSGIGILSPREEEVAHWVAEGLMNREIAEKLNLSENTVKNYLFRIFEKLGISSRVELILYTASQFAGQQPATQRFSMAAGDIEERLRIEMSRKATENLTSPYELIAEAYRYGLGAEQNKISALVWFIIAEHVGTRAAASAVTAREQLERELPKREVVIANKRAAELLRKANSLKVDGEDQRPEKNAS
jgi:DNA-binding NarL/FixJ family response regulator